MTEREVRNMYDQISFEAPGFFGRESIHLLFNDSGRRRFVSLDTFLSDYDILRSRADEITKDPQILEKDRIATFELANYKSAEKIMKDLRTLKDSLGNI